MAVASKPRVYNRGRELYAILTILSVHSLSFSLSLSLSAFPSLDRNITSTKLPPASIGDTILVPCAFQRDAFRDRYQITWYRGEERVDPAVSKFSRFSVQRDFSLSITDVQSSDASELYQCELNVTDEMQTFVRRAPFIIVDVLGMVLLCHKKELWIC